jgi:hypothetical protein
VYEPAQAETSIAIVLRRKSLPRVGVANAVAVHELLLTLRDARRGVVDRLKNTRVKPEILLRLAGGTSVMANFVVVIRLSSD